MAGDFYQTLGISKSASAEEIKRAYRKLAHQHHPDKQGGDEAKFKQINEAYQILSDPQKRQQYDRFGPAFAQGSGGRGQQGGQGFDGFDFSQFTGQGGIDIEDIFEMFGSAFGGARGPRRASEDVNRGADLQTSMTISFYEMARGGSQTLELTKDALCETCQGSGVKAGTELAICSVCNGKGEVRENSASIFGNITRINVCSVCRGAGKIPKDNCSNCKGEGRKKTNRSLNVEIPAGIADGQTLVVRAQGQAGFRSGKAGDLYIRMRVTPDKRFARDDNDIFYEMSVKVTDAILGADLTIPTLDGDKTITLPAGTEPNAELRLKGAGVHGRHKGDQIIKIKIAMPRKLSGKAKKLAEELAKEI